MTAVSIQQAACNALATWIGSKLTDCKVEPRWVEPTVELPSKAITIVAAGAADDDIFDSVLDSDTPAVVVDATHKTFAWRFRCRRQPIQLDVWTIYDVDRDDIISRLDSVLNASESLTVGRFNADPIRHGVLVNLSDGWTGVADCYFDSPDITDTPNANQQTEYRATYRGHVDVMLTAKATSPVIAQAILRQQAKQGTSAPTTTDVVTVTSSGTTYTTEGT